MRTVKDLSLYASLLLVVLFYSCAPSLSEIWINEDGSGRSEMTFDIAEYAEMFEMMLAEEAKENGDPESKPRDIFGGESMRTSDTIINFFDMTPDSVKQRMSGPDQLKKIEILGRMDKEAEEFFIRMQIDYDSDEDLVKLMETMASMKEEGAVGNPMLSMTTDEEMNQMFVQSKHDRDQHVVRVSKMNLFEEMKKDPMLAGQLDSLEQVFQEMPGEMESEELEMLKMMFGKSTTVLHLPNKVLFTNDPDAVIDGNTVTFTLDPISMIQKGEENVLKEWIIKYK